MEDAVCVRGGVVGGGCGGMFWLGQQQCTVVFLAAIFFCQIVFGIYAMICESRRRRLQARIRGRPMPELPELNPVIHGKLRLALLSLLVGGGRGGVYVAARPRQARRMATWARN